MKSYLVHIAASFADAVCRRGERCIYFSFEESPNQIIRNMRSIGIDLDRWVKNDLLRFHAVRATFYALEMHLLKMHQLIDVYSGPAGVLTGTARSSQEAKEKSEKRVREQEIEVMQRKMERKRKVMDTRIAAMQADFQAEEEGLKRLIKQQKEREQLLVQDREKIGLMRGKDKD